MKRVNRYRLDKKRRCCRRLAAIEPIIGHIKADFRLAKISSKALSARINVLMAAVAWNFGLWMRLFCPAGGVINTQQDILQGLATANRPQEFNGFAFQRLKNTAG